MLTAFWPSSAEDRTEMYPGMRPREVPAAVACVDRKEPLSDSVIKPDAAEIKHTRSRAKSWRANEEFATEQEQLSDPPRGRRRTRGNEARAPPVFQPSNGDETQTIQAPAERQGDSLSFSSRWRRRHVREVGAVYSRGRSQRYGEEILGGPTTALSRERSSSWQGRLWLANVVAVWSVPSGGSSCAVVRVLRTRLSIVHVHWGLST